MSATSLVTNGYICYAGKPIPVPQPATPEAPRMTGAIEIRPRIRTVTTPAEDGDPKPTMTAAQELKPQMVGSRSEPEPSPTTDPPTNISAQELKPKMVSAEEDDD